MKPAIMMVAAAAALAGCSGGGEQPKAKEGKAAALQPGEYEVSAKVDTIRSTDNTTPAIAAKAGDTVAAQRTCIPADGKFDSSLFTQAGDTCTEQSNFVRRGRMSIQYQCTRPGKGPVTELVDGKFKADSFDATVTTQTYMSGSGDYEMVRSFTGRRVGECSAAPAPAPAEG